MAYTSPPALPQELWGCIEVFRNIASHGKFHHQINEISGKRRACIGGHELLSDEDEPNNNREWAVGYYNQCREEVTERHESEEGEGYPNWFKSGCEETLYVLKCRERRNVDRPDHIARREQVFAQPSLREAWQHYLELLLQQKDVLAGWSDLEAFAFGVTRFPALKRVTITPAAHGSLITPLYPTPMIRVFPKGFNYPIRRVSLYPRATMDPATPYPWNQYPELRDRYRGFRTALRVLANEPNSVSELVMTSNFIPTGINCTIFDEPCEEYNHFATVLKKPGFRRLDIALLLGGEREEDLEACWRSLLNGRLRQALGEAKEMEEFRLHTTFDDELYPDGGHPLIPLQSIVPVEQWSKLRHFELSGFVISQDDCVSFLKTSQKSVRSIELSMLEEIKRMVSESTLWETGLRDQDPKSRSACQLRTRALHMDTVYGLKRGWGISSSVKEEIPSRRIVPLTSDLELVL
ncbi:hypothetical protein N7535_001796 [Penicillium sp. DV-2018c]|nr:hypothetical protein N7535_001796 [Penicillium sp. DV-2018c]